MLPKNWKKSFISGIVIPTKLRFCNECSKKKRFDRCRNQINENKEFKANINLLRRQPPNQFGRMLPYYRV